MSARQGDLFSGSDAADPTNDGPGRKAQLPDQLIISAVVLRDWQTRIHRHQAPLFEPGQARAEQARLVGLSHKTSCEHSASDDPLRRLKPLVLRPLPLSFWRWPNSPHQGAAIYLVMDRPAHLSTPILLYVGETVAADRRWKGEHDCKAYLSAYGEALSSAGLSSSPSIRFWGDVPKATMARRRLEQQLIQTWLPPFNKETRERWATPFNAD